jgi:hypothetical protein
MKKSKKKNIKLPTVLIEIYEDERQAGILIARAAVMDLVRKAQISPHMGAEILGMRYEDFAVMAKGEDIPLIDYG